jgi:GNAT superfamily N-acetyltransferase
VVWTRRAALPSDEAFLYRLYCSTRDEEMALWGAPAEQKQAFLTMQFRAQGAHYGRHFARAEHTIVLVGGEPVGRVLVDRSAAEIRLVDIALLPEHRGAGLGGALVDELLAEAAATGTPVRLHAFKPSRAVAFYERRGFERVADAQMYWALEWNPSRRAGPSDALSAASAP